MMVEVQEDRTRHILRHGDAGSIRGPRLALVSAAAICFLAVSAAGDRDAGSGDTGSGSEATAFPAVARPLLERHCIGCHNPEQARGDLNLEDHLSTRGAAFDGETWERVLRRVEAGEMPPPGRPRPSAEEVSQLSEWIRAEIARADRAAKRDPGRVTLRRLNRTEYSNTVRDLLCVEYRTGDDFPSDDVGYGFDNIGDVLSLPPLLMEKYLAAAERIAAEALRQGGEGRKRILPCDPWRDGATREEKDDCLRGIVRGLASRAYRRAVTDEDVTGLVGLARAIEKDGGSPEEVLRSLIEAILVSPHFLFRVELDPAPDDPEHIHPVTDHELASRLSYFLWSTMPDEELFRLASEGALRREGELAAQVRRMLGDPRSRALVENFAPQWLQIRGMRAVAPDPKLFPGFGEALRDSMLREVELFFEKVMREDLSVMEFLDADWTLVDERLARHYGIAGVDGAEFRRVKLTGADRRGGVLTMASVLLATSNPTRTSPVKRGKWVLEVLLGAPPPPPPPDVPPLPEKPGEPVTGTLRQRMEQHRADPACATCHQTMDPLGFGLENFDAVGAWREKEGDFPIDASGVLPDGKSFRGPGELRAVLREKKGAFRRALVEKMLTYALGRGLEAYDRPSVDRIAEALPNEVDRFSALILAVVASDPFQMRRGDRRQETGGRRQP